MAKAGREGKDIGMGGRRDPGRKPVRPVEYRSQSGKM
ncbi:hypothetical protein X760_29455 [Mesorhizobium sp. LSHC422A00]|nr:hypothetical protein X770_07350 [Mesorhizobium sp. LSJC269B00]ESX53439.1 hypothetical protein X760_29455 [Mesorhizobium sp. LSHC422A00]